MGESIPITKPVLKLIPQIREAFKPFQEYMQIEGAKEIVINRPLEVGVEINGGWEWHDDMRFTRSFLQAITRVFATESGQDFKPEDPIVGFKFPDGSRVQVVAGSYAGFDFAMTVRINRGIKFELKDWGFSEYDISAITTAIAENRTILISGGTSSGKTSLLNTIIRMTNLEERIVSLEGVPELEIPHRNWCPLYYSENNTSVGEVGIKDLLNTTLRLRPDRILMGEIRKENAYTFSHAINTGHEGSMATIHSNSPDAALKKIADYSVLAGDISGASIPVLIDQLKEDIYGAIQLTTDKKTHKKHGIFQRFQT